MPRNLLLRAALNASHSLILSNNGELIMSSAGPLQLALAAWIYASDVGGLTIFSTALIQPSIS